MEDNKKRLLSFLKITALIEIIVIILLLLNSCGNGINIGKKQQEKTKVSYTIEYYLQNIENDGYTLKDTVNYEGYSQDKVKAQIISYDYFTFEENNPNNILEITLQENSENILKCYYQRKTMSFVYDNNGGETTEGSNNEIIRYGEKAKAPQVKKDGYIFMGWATEPGGEVVYENNEDIEKIIFESDDTIELYAIWEANGYLVVFNANGGIGKMGNQTIILDKATKLKANVFTKTNYIFDGWNTKADGSGKSYQDKEEVLNLKKKKDEKITLYAQWMGKIVTVTYQTNGGTFLTQPETEYRYGDSITSIPDIDQAPQYKIFAGWHLKQDFSDNDVTSITKLTGDITLYAKYADKSIFYKIVDSVLHIYATPGDGRLERILYNDSELSKNGWYTASTTFNKAIIEEEIHPYTMWRFFDQCSNMTTIEKISNLKTEEAISMKACFQQCNKLASFDLSGFDTRKTVDMSWMFNKCYAIKELDLSNFDTSKVTLMDFMFNNCDILEIIDCSSFDTSKVTTMKAMFQYCPKLKTVDLSGFDTSKVVDFGWMFYGDLVIENLDFTHFDTRNLEAVQSMFYNCKRLNNIDVSSFDTSKVTNMAWMFTGVGVSLNEPTNIIGLENFDTSKVTTLQGTFGQESNTGIGKLSNETMSGIKDWDVSSCTNFICTFYGQGTYLSELDISKWDVSSAESFNNMFCDNYKLKKLDLSNWDVSNVKSINRMFDDCLALETLGDVSNWDTSSLVDASHWLNNCSKFVGNNGTLDLSGWTTPVLRGAREMFRTIKVDTIDISSMDTSKINGTAWSGAGASGGTYYDYGTNISGMFKDCSNLKTIYVGDNFVTSQLTSAQTANMFAGCSKLVGGNGTIFDPNIVDKTYALIDKEGQKGYFTTK